MWRPPSGLPDAPIGCKRPPDPMPYAQTNVALYRQLMAAAWSDADLGRAGAAHELALRLFAGRFRASGKPFLAHLVGTASIAQAHGGAPGVVLAGLLHAAYAQDGWGDGLAGAAAARRAVVAGAAGAEAERLVAGYTRLRWPATEGEPALLFLRVANELEDHLDGAMHFAHKAGPDPSRAAMVLGVARAGGHAALADELEAALADRPRVPEGLVRRDAAAFNAAPPRPASGGARRWLARGLRRALAG